MFRVVESPESILERVKTLVKGSGIDVHVLGTGEPIVLSSKYGVFHKQLNSVECCTSSH